MRGENRAYEAKIYLQVCVDLVFNCSQVCGNAGKTEKDTVVALMFRSEEWLYSHTFIPSLILI